MKKSYYIGFDLGSDSVHAVVLDDNSKIVYSPESRVHFSNPIKTLKDVYEEILSRYDFEDIAGIAVTGSGGEVIAKKTGVPFFHDSISIPTGASLIASDAEYIFHVGAKDSYFFEKDKVQAKHEWKSFVSDHDTGTKCGGGSGILIAKQCRRFFEHEFPIKLGNDRKENMDALQKQLEHMFKRAEEEIEKSDKDITVGGRCGIVIQSDMIHLQNRGEQIKNILKGMFRSIMKNYKCDVIKTRVLDSGKKAIATGGIFGNTHLVRMLEKETGNKIEVPENYNKVGAIGAVIKAKSLSKNQKFKPEEIISIANSEKEKIKTAPPLYSALDKVKIYDEEKEVAKEDDLIIYDDYKSKTGERPENKREVVIGVDGGSTTTKAIVADAHNLKIIAEVCLYTNGKPLQTAQEMFRQIRKHIGESIDIRGVAYTGSSGAFYYKLFTNLEKNPEKICVDIVKDEITCHAFGVRQYNNKVDTIFELGGQDAKFTLFNNDGTVKKAKMNLSCMAGTGQTMHNMVEIIGLDIRTTFHEYALKAKRTPVVDETCGVFTEAGIAKLVAMDFSKEEIAAAIAFGFMGGYVNKFIGNEKFGEYASAQGGPFNGKSCLAALALHTGMEIHAFPHRQLFGALGAAIAVHNEIKKLEKESHKNNVDDNKVDSKVNNGFESKFRSLDIADMTFEKSVENCSKIIKDSCGARDCQLQAYKVGNDTIVSGGICPKGNTDTAVKKAPKYIDSYKRILDKHLTRHSIGLDDDSKKERILIPRSLTFLNEKGVFYAALYNQLGFDICTSPESDDEIAELGINYSHSEMCYPVKLAHGHGAFLKKYLRKGKDKMLLVNVISSEKEKYKFCPYVAGAGFLVKDAVNMGNDDVLLPVIYFNDSCYKIGDSILKDLNRVYANRFSLHEVSHAVEKAKKAEDEFLEEVYSTGENIVKSLKEKGEKIFFGIGRGYTMLDNKASSKVHELFASHGLHFVPSFFLKAPDYDIKEIVDNMYWFQGQKIIKYNILAAMEPLFYPVRETNFNCGTDSVLLYHEEDIINKSEKPHLVLQTDGHNSNAQFGTRILANYEVVKKHRPKILRLEDLKKKNPPAEMKNRIMGIPNIGEVSNMLSAALKSFGFKSEVMPTYTEKSQEFARRFVSTNTCRPFAFQVGDSLAWLHELKEKGINPNKHAAVFEAKAKGPCRYGQYAVMLRRFFDENGFHDVPVIAPDANEDYTNLPLSKLNIVKLSKLFYKGVYCHDMLYDALLRTRPYEKEEGSAEKEHNALYKELYKLIEDRASTKELAAFMQKAKERFEVLVDKNKERKPIVIMNGEIFVRCHPKANQDSIKLLEKYGLEVILNPVSQWLEYVNKSTISINKDSNDWKNFIISLLKKRFMEKTTSKLYAPFAGYLKGREQHDPMHVLDIAQNDLVYEKKIRGEGPISIGETYMFSKGDLPNICGIYHVGPFGCMQETAATSQIHALIQKQRKKAKDMHERIIPFMDAVFGDSELSNLESEIAAFAEKCQLKKEALAIVRENVS